MKCHEAERAMVLSYYDDLDDGARKALEDHCGECPACVRKAAAVRADLEEIARLSGPRPEWDGERSWQIIRQGLPLRSRARARRSSFFWRLLPAAGLGIFVLGILIGRHALRTVPADLKSGPAGQMTAARLLQPYLEEAEIALREVANIDPETGSRRLLASERERARSLGFRNGIMRAIAKTTGDPALGPLFDDLEVILLEAANLDAGSTEAVKRLKALIREKGILFRIRELKSPSVPLPGGKEVL
jgi:hypothetical protein